MAAPRELARFHPGDQKVASNEIPPTEAIECAR